MRRRQTSPVFEVVNGQPAGNHRVDIYVNNEMVTADVHDDVFKETGMESWSLLRHVGRTRSMGVDTASFPELAVSD